MTNYKQLFMRYLDNKGIRYVDADEFKVKVTFAGNNLKSIPVHVFFDEDGDGMVKVICWDVANFKDKEAKGIAACNELNKKYRGVKFHIDKDSDVIVSMDGYIDENFGSEVCGRLLMRVFIITDEAYPTFARAMWS